jgi:GT2 family glycosyltransferase
MLEKIGGWDTRFVLYCSDLDLCIRAAGAGYKVVWAVRTVVEHESYATLRRMPQKVREGIIKKDEKLYATKHPYELHGKDGGVTAKRGFGRAIYPQALTGEAQTARKEQTVA